MCVGVVALHVCCFAGFCLGNLDERNDRKRLGEFSFQFPTQTLDSLFMFFTGFGTHSFRMNQIRFTGTTYIVHTWHASSQVASDRIEPRFNVDMFSEKSKNGICTNSMRRGQFYCVWTWTFVYTLTEYNYLCIRHTLEQSSIELVCPSVMAAQQQQLQSHENTQKWKMCRVCQQITTDCARMCKEEIFCEWVRATAETIEIEMERTSHISSTVAKNWIEFKYVWCVRVCS